MKYAAAVCYGVGVMLMAEVYQQQEWWVACKPQYNLNSLLMH